MKNNTDINLLYIKYFSGNASEEEKRVIFNYLKQSEQDRRYFEELRNVWEVNHPAFEPSEIDVNSAYHKLVNSLGSEPKPKAIYRIIHSYWKYAVAVALIPLIIASFFIFNDTRTTNRHAENVYKEIVSPAGKITNIVLSDGTRVTLNVYSKLKYPETFQGKQRCVALEGEGYFDVSHDESHPFIVHTEKMNIQVLGTKFNVNAYEDLSEVKTTLEEGKVRVTINDNTQQEDIDNSFCLIPNEQLTINAVTGDISKNQVDVAEVNSWMTGGMVFNSSLLNDVLKQIARKYNIEIENKNSQDLAHKRLTVRFERNECLGDVLCGLEVMIPGLSISRLSDTKYQVLLSN